MNSQVNDHQHSRGLRKHNDHNKGFNSGSMGTSETAPDIDNKAGSNGNGNKEDVLIETASNDNLIPLGENRIPEHDEVVIFDLQQI